MTKEERVEAAEATVETTETMEENAAELTEEVEETSVEDGEMNGSSEDTNANTAENENLAQELEESKDRLLRLHAEFDNYRKRTQREKEDWHKFAAMDLMEKLLPVLDNFERAIESVKNEGEEVQKQLSGVEMIFRQLTEILQKEGLEPIEALGKMFDPNLHEAMMQVPVAEDQEDGQVVVELRRGYSFKGRVIRPSLVQVAKQ
ncbi:MAG: nucleotide exchange factor GrpE [Peptococcia bacterium]